MSINSAFFNQLKSALVPLLKNVIAKFETDIASVQSRIKTDSAGVLQSPVTVAGGDSASAGKIALDHTQSGQITDENTSTLFGFLSNNTGDLTVGGSGYAMKLRGNATRPKYNNNELARLSDLPSVPSGIVTGKDSGGASKAYTIQVVSALPASPDENTIYIIV